MSSKKTDNNNSNDREAVSPTYAVGPSQLADLQQLFEEAMDHIEQTGEFAQKLQEQQKRNITPSDFDLKILMDQKEKNDELINRLAKSMPFAQKADVMSELQIYKGVYARLTPVYGNKLKY